MIYVYTVSEYGFNVLIQVCEAINIHAKGNKCIRDKSNHCVPSTLRPVEIRAD